jgi:Glycosyl transferase family 2
MLGFVTVSLDGQMGGQMDGRHSLSNQPEQRVLVIVPAFQEEASVANVVRQIRSLSVRWLTEASTIAGTSPSNTNSPSGTTAELARTRTPIESVSSAGAMGAVGPAGAMSAMGAIGAMDHPGGTATNAIALDVLVVDDGSTDATAARARSAGAIVASLPVNLGVGAALQTGFRYAVQHGYTTVVTIDADGQHPVSHIPALLSVPDVALVVGSRFVPGSVAPEWVSSTRSAAMGVLRRRLTTRTGVRLYDPTSGFRVIREPLLTRFALDFPATYLGDTFEAHLSAAAVLDPDQIVEVSVPMKARVTGVPSSVGLRNLAYFARALLTTARPVWKPLGSDADFPEKTRRLDESKDRPVDEVASSAFAEPVVGGSNPLGESGFGVEAETLIANAMATAPSITPKGTRA